MMVKTFLFLSGVAVGSGVVHSAKAAAAYPASLTCISEILDDALEADLSARLLDAMDGKTSGTDLYGPHLDTVVAASKKCEVENRWTAREAALANLFEGARIAMAAARHGLEKDGRDASSLASKYAAMPVERRRALIAQPVASDVVREVMALGADGPQSKAARQHVFAYFEALAGAEFYASDFSTK